ncbi:MAG: Mov34/MPN/PAD-1 family protein [Gemmatimonadota bacterium]|nr:Mov34/MPN/PAD-1 family protein [Gemmatimonadota bacterium]
MDRSVWSKIHQHARCDYPAECCGIVSEASDGAFRVHPCENIQDRLHARNPEEHPRTSKNAYRMDDLEVHRIFTETESAGGRVVAFYHSHVDCGAYFSEEDRQAAMFMDQPAFPEVVYVVVSVVEGAVRGAAGFAWDERTKTFAKKALEGYDPGIRQGSHRSHGRL